MLIKGFVRESRDASIQGRIDISQLIMLTHPSVMLKLSSYCPETEIKILKFFDAC